MTKTKTVHSADGREWTVSRKLEWSVPPVQEDFEHDLDGGRPAAFLVLSIVLVIWVVLFVWSPEQVYAPWWVWLAGLVVIGFFPVRWVLRRPWTLVAETSGDYRTMGEDAADAARPSGEHWVGTVRGVVKAREEVQVITRSLRTRSTPSYTDGPLQPVS